jgi:hypothetical protein
VHCCGVSNFYPVGQLCVVAGFYKQLFVKGTHAPLIHL